MTLGDDRWVEISPSQFKHETDGLNYVRELLPNASPYRAWSNFEFRDNHGRWHEVDLLVLARDQLHLIELKYYSGVLRGDDHRWLRSGHRAEDSPLKLARRKAQYLATRLRDSLLQWARQNNVRIPDTRDVVPFVQESVFLHHERLRCELSEHSAQGLYGLDGHERTTGLPGISELLLAEPRPHRTVTGTQDRVIPVLMKRLGLKPNPERTAGSWIIEHSLISQGEGWQDWSARHQVTEGQQARIRFRVAPDGASAATTDGLRQLAKHEYATVSRLVHDGLLRPLDVVESELGTGVVYPADDSLQRLDLWLAGRQLAFETQLAIARQIAEAVHYAHGNAVAHRNLTPESIWVREDDDGAVKVLVGDWHSAGSATQDTQAAGVTALLRTEPDDDAHAAFRAPEGTWNVSATDRFRLDVFSLGALTYYLLTGSAPAASAAALRDRLRTQGGIDLSPDLPEVAEPLRTLVLNATRPAPSDRTPDLATFLEELAAAESALNEPDEPALDPLEALPGALLGDRFELVRRLGKGSTAVGLLVEDHGAPGKPQRVLKVALDDDAAHRLDDEAAVLSRLSSPRIVKLIEGPIDVGGRRALLMESAGDLTLAEEMRERTRLSLDLLQRYGTDLLKALVDLDRAGVDHRDIKPANLGVRQNRSDRAKHLVLFDFSLARAAASATEAGTPPYLDPFLGTEGRESFDTAAERYAAAVVLFEMATGQVPVYGDGAAHPATVPDEATIHRQLFDPAIASAMVKFFRTALARDAAQRHHTAAEMLQAWEAAFPPSLTTVPDDADKLVESATLATPLAKAGLTARALSAVEHLGVRTVGDLVMVDPVVLARLGGTAVASRTEVSKRAKEWRTKFKDQIRGTSPRPASATLPTPSEAADLLMRHTGRGTSQSRKAMVRLLLGVLDADVDAFATQAQLASNLPTPVTTARASQLLSELQEAWASNSRTRELLTTLDKVVRRRVNELGGVATVDELAGAVLDELAPTPVRDDEREESRLAAGILRIVLDRERALARAGDDVVPLALRRQQGRPALVATRAELLDLADHLGREADRLVSTGDTDSHDTLVPADLVAERLGRHLRDLDEAPTELADPSRLAGLAAAVSTRAAASAAAELHHRDLPAEKAVAYALRGVAAHQRLSPATVRERVRVRFPALPELPPRPALDDVVARADIGLIFDTELDVYRSRTAGQGTTGLETRQETNVVIETAPISAAGVAGQRLRDSRNRRSFLALGVPGHRLHRAIRVLTAEFGAHPLDLTNVLLRELRAQADSVGMSWSTIEAADAAAPGTRPAQGLGALVARAVPAVTAAVEEAMEGAPDGERPVLLTDAAPLARYGHMSVLTQWTDLSRTRRQAVWLLVPQLRGSHGPMLDGQPVTLNSPGQFLHLDTEWIDTRDRALTPVGDPS